MDPSPYIQFFFQLILPTHRNANLRTFRELYGVHFYTAAIIYMYAVIYDPIITPFHILWFLHWIKQYPQMDVGAFYWKCDVKTYRKYLLKVLFAVFLAVHTVCVLWFDCSVCQLYCDV
jgi:hypothetical protein